MRTLFSDEKRYNTLWIKKEVWVMKTQRSPTPSLLLVDFCKIIGSFLLVYILVYLFIKSVSFKQSQKAVTCPIESCPIESELESIRAREGGSFEDLGDNRLAGLVHQPEEIPLAASPLLLVREGDYLDEQLGAICDWDPEEVEYWWINVVNINNLTDQELISGFKSTKLLVLPLRLVEDHIRGNPHLLAIAVLR